MVRLFYGSNMDADAKITKTTDVSEDFTNEEITKILEVACEILQEVIPVELDNGELSLEDLELYNDRVQHNAVYSSMVYPARTVWIDAHPAEDFDFLLDREIADKFVEINFFFSDVGHDEDDKMVASDNDRCFAVVLMPKPEVEDAHLRECAAVHFFPDKEFLTAGFEPAVLDIPAEE